MLQQINLIKHTSNLIEILSELIYRGYCEINSKQLCNENYCKIIANIEHVSLKYDELYGEITKSIIDITTKLNPKQLLKDQFELLNWFIGKLNFMLTVYVLTYSEIIQTPSFINIRDIDIY